jgi:hypothetical protein
MSDFLKRTASSDRAHHDAQRTNLLIADEILDYFAEIQKLDIEAQLPISAFLLIWLSPY